MQFRFRGLPHLNEINAQILLDLFINQIKDIRRLNGGPDQQSVKDIEANDFYFFVID